jgi:hypothetical protein
MWSLNFIFQIRKLNIVWKGCVDSRRVLHVSADICVSSEQRTVFCHAAELMNEIIFVCWMFHLSCDSLHQVAFTLYTISCIRSVVIAFHSCLCASGSICGTYQWAQALELLVKFYAAFIILLVNSIKKCWHYCMVALHTVG